MTETKPVAPDGDEQLLEWPNKDNRRFVRAVYRVGDLDRTIKFYTECLGMELLRKYEVSNEKHTKAIMGFGPEESSFVLELTYGFGHFAIATQDVYKMVENVRAKGGENMIIREPFELKGSPVLLLAYVKDPNGYIFELIQRGQTPQPLCHLMLRVADLQRSIDFYQKALGMRVLTKVESLEQKYAIALMGYADELETTAVELTYNHGVTQHSKGNGYSQVKFFLLTWSLSLVKNTNSHIYARFLFLFQVAIGTDDVYKSAEIVNLITKELGGKITQPPSLDSQMNSKIISFLDPDGWQIVSFPSKKICDSVKSRILFEILEDCFHIPLFTCFLMFKE
ncbi:lactoylglutathione lyase GLX1 isoform X2 [Cucumis melo]|uniref:Lactoylglutathione lyase GLX1 isoform X2 n=1 Tax=Cucumis melo TaxID=3656 RepID=A0ABM3KDZ9_CUCME|nr:lactoylglutathione lyase GLX1 isoform X2 [Cucumis melo]